MKKAAGVSLIIVPTLLAAYFTDGPEAAFAAIVGMAIIGMIGAGVILIAES